MRCCPYRPFRPDGQALHCCSAPAITIVGNVTIDIVDGKRVLGGAVSYAAAVAAAWGQRACIVAAAADDAPLGATFEASVARPAVWGIPDDTCAGVSGSLVWFQRKPGPAPSWC